LYFIFAKMEIILLLLLLLEWNFLGNHYFHCMEPVPQNAAFQCQNVDVQVAQDHQQLMPYFGM